jgi:uncharacterized membrane protein
MLIALLALGGVFLSVYLTLHKLGYIGHLACAIASCELVQSSRWSVLLDIPVAAWGAAFYATTFAIAFLGTQERFADSRAISRLLTAMTGWGVLFSTYLTGLEVFAIHGYCMYCLTSAALVVVLFVLSVRDLREFGAAPLVLPAGASPE